MNKCKADFDEFQKRSEITNNAVLLHKTLKDEPKLGRIIYFLNETMDIIYIGNTTGLLVDLESYISEVAKTRMASAYYVEIIRDENFADALAERILIFSPYENKQLPKSDKFISATEAKADYRIDKKAFQKFITSRGGYRFKERLYGLRVDFLDEFGLFDKFSKNSPKVGSEIVTNDCELWDEIVENANHIFWGYIESVEEFESKDGTGEIIEVLRRERKSDDEIRRQQTSVLNSSWTVTAVFPDRFIAAHNKTGKVKTFLSDDFKVSWTKGLTREFLI